jgi:cytochrome c oxidase subunit 4
MADEEKSPETEDAPTAGTQKEASGEEGAETKQDEVSEQASESERASGDAEGSSEESDKEAEVQADSGDSQTEDSVSDEQRSAAAQLADADEDDEERAPLVAAMSASTEDSVEAPHHSSDHGHGHGDHFAHVLPMSLLGGVLVALILLTILTVGVTAIDLGSQGNFVVAMIIATVKAGLVMGYFMHMVWDSKFNVVAFLSSFLFVLLFLAMTLTDRSEYQHIIDTWQADQEAMAQ